MSLVGLTLDYCRLPSTSITFTTRDSNGFSIENGNWALDTNTLTVGQATIVSGLQLDVSTLGQKSNFEISFSSPSIIETGSYATVQIADLSLLSSSICSVVTGVAYGINCQIIAGSPNTLRLAFTQTVPARVSITIRGRNLQNPKTTKTISLPINVFSSGGCLFLTGSGSASIAGVARSTSFEVTTSNKYLNMYSEHRFKWVPAEPSWNNNDYVIVEVPYGLSTKVACTPISSSIVSMACSSNNITSFKASLNINASTYITSQTMEFSVSYVLNPPQAGTNVNFKASIVTLDGGSSSPTVFESTPPVVGISYENYLTANFANIAFSSNLRGYTDYVKYNLSVNTLLAENSSVVLTLSNKFENLSQATLVSSSPSMQLSTSNSETRVLTLKLAAQASPGAALLFTLKLANPTNELISTSDVAVEIWQGSTKNKVTAAFPVSSSLSFVCDTICQDCGKLHSECTVCAVNYTLTGTTCIETIKKKPTALEVRSETSIPFICLGIAVLITLIMVVVGLICKRCLYWGNFLYALLRPVYTGSILLFVYFAYKNDESYWVIIAGLCILGIHVLISTIGTIFTIRALTKATLGAQTTQNRFVNVFLDNYREKNSEKIRQPTFTLWVTRVIAPAVGFGAFRWFFSAPMNGKGYFWYFDTPSFNFMKSVLQRFNMLYIFFVHIGLIIVVSVSLAQTIYLFKLETISISMLDLLVYVVAYFELNPFTLRKVGAKTKAKESVARDVDQYHKIDGQNLTIAGEPSRIQDNSQLGDDNAPGTPSRRRKDSQDERSKIEMPLSSKHKMDHTGDLNDSKDQRTPSKTNMDDDLSKNIKETEDIFEYGSGKSLSSIPSESEANLHRDVAKRRMPEFNPRIDNALEATTLNNSEVRQIGPDEILVVGQRVCLSFVGSNLKNIGYSSSMRTSKESSSRTPYDYDPPRRLSSELEVIFEADEADIDGKWDYQITELPTSSPSKQRSIARSSSMTSRFNQKKKRQVTEIVGEQACYSENYQWTVFDRMGRSLNLKNKTTNGQFEDDEGRPLNFAFESEEGLRNGVILTRQGQKLQVQDQDFKLLAEEGKLVDHEGKVVEIFGQKPTDVEAGILRLDDGTIVNIACQKDALLRKGIIVKEDGTCLNTKIPQDKNLLAEGIFLDQNGKSCRLIDQTAVALKANEVKGFGGDAVFEPRAPKKPNKAYFRSSEISEDDPFRQEVSSKTSSVMMLKGNLNGLKAGLIDLHPKRSTKSKTATMEDDYSEFLGFHNRDSSINDHDRQDKMTVTKDFSKGESSYQDNINMARDSTKQLSKPSPAFKVRTEVPSLKFITDSPYQPKVSNFINHPDPRTESGQETLKSSMNHLEVLSADQLGMPEPASRDHNGSATPLRNSKDSQERPKPGRSPKKINADAGIKRSPSP